MGALTVAEVVTLLAALINASPKLIQIVQAMHERGAAPDSLLSPEDQATVKSVLGEMATSMPQQAGDAVLAAMSAAG